METNNTSETETKEISLAQIKTEPDTADEAMEETFDNERRSAKGTRSEVMKETVNQKCAASTRKSSRARRKKTPLDADDLSVTKYKPASKDKAKPNSKDKAKPKAKPNKRKQNVPQKIQDGKRSVKSGNLDEPNPKPSSKSLLPRKRSNVSVTKLSTDDAENDPDFVPYKKKKRSKGVSSSSVHKSPRNKMKFQCSVCKLEVNSATTLKMHMFKHNEFKCKYCGIQFRSVKGWQRHEQRHRCGENKLQFVCKHCKVSYKIKHFFEKHQEACQGPHVCDCGKEFGNMLRLKKHKRTHCPLVPKSSRARAKEMCSFCGKVVSRGSLSKHFRVHSKVMPHVCSICGRVFRTKKALMYHEGLHQQSGEINLDLAFRCRYCNKPCKSQLYLNFHEKRHQGLKPYQCDVCEESFFNINKYYEHQRIHQEKPSFQCEICNKTYKNSRSLERHIKTHTYENAVQCKVCLKMFSTMGNLKVNERIHTLSVKFQCKLCTRFFAQKSHLHYHEQTHIENRPMYECPQCDAKYTTSYYRDMHLRFKHTKKDLPTCPHCNKIFETQTACKKHIYSVCRPEEEEDGVYCRQCGKKMKNSYYLSQHMKLEHNESNFTCTVCNYVAGKSSALKTHMSIHTGERPYKCSHCDRAFKQKTTLANHERLHTGEKPYKCDLCDKAFIQKYNLTCHMRTHTGDRPWHCKVCDKGFTQQTNLKTHEQKCNGKVRSAPTSRYQRPKKHASDTLVQPKVPKLTIPMRMVQPKPLVPPTITPQRDNMPVNLIKAKPNVPVNLIQPKEVSVKSATLVRQKELSVPVNLIEIHDNTSSADALKVLAQEAEATQMNQEQIVQVIAEGAEHLVEGESQVIVYETRTTPTGEQVVYKTMVEPVEEQTVVYETAPNEEQRVIYQTGPNGEQTVVYETTTTHIETSNIVYQATVSEMTPTEEETACQSISAPEEENSFVETTTTAPEDEKTMVDTTTSVDGERPFIDDTTATAPDGEHTINQTTSNVAGEELAEPVHEASSAEIVQETSSAPEDQQQSSSQVGEQMINFGNASGMLSAIALMKDHMNVQEQGGQ